MVVEAGSRDAETALRQPENLRQILKRIREQDPDFATRVGGRLGAVREQALRAAEAAGELGDDPELALGEALRYAAEGAGEILLAEYGRRERYLREVEALDTEAARLTDWFVEQYRTASLEFLHERCARIRQDLEQDHRWHTGLKDTGRKIYSETRGMLSKGARLLKEHVPELDINISDEKRDWESSLLERATSKHLSEADFETFDSDLRQRLGEELGTRWRSAASRAIKHMEDAFGGAPPGGLELRADGPEFVLDEASKVAIAGAGAAVAATLVLAAGWHTLAWSAGGLFLPLLPVVAILTLGTAWFRKDEALEDLIDAVKKRESMLESALEDGAKYRIRVEVGKANQEAAEAIKRELFSRAVGKFDAALLDDLLRCLEEYIDDLIDRAKKSPSSDAYVKGMRWLDRARAALESGDDLTAAMYGGLAFEQLLRDINREHRVGFDFRVPHHNAAFLARLAESDVLPREKLDRLHGLKSRRDLFTHRMHQVAALPEKQRRKTIEVFIDDIRELESFASSRSCCSA